ncbi:MAG: hypothetical protein SPG27_13045 [Butyricimonas virosa]|nr:hypothetical protein [Butyricimonas virosa]
MDDNGKHLIAGLRRGKEEAFAYVFRMYYIIKLCRANLEGY